MTRSNEKIFLFMDANMHLHFKEFDQIDWLNILNCKSVCLIFAPITISELDKFKNDRNSERRRNRSRMISKKINEIIMTSEPNTEVSLKKRKGVTVRLLSDSPDLSSYPGLQQGIGDDELIASIMQFISKNPEIKKNNVVLISDDNGILNKARAREIKILQVDESFRLPDELTIDQEKIKKLESRIKEIENQQPQLKLAFVEKGTCVEKLHFDLKTIPDLDTQSLENFVDQESKAISWFPTKTQHSKKELSQKQDNKTTVLDVISRATNEYAEEILSIGLNSQIPQSEIDRYQKDTEKHLNLYRNYLKNNHTFEKLSNLSRSLDFQVLNDGNCSAQDVIIQVIFPEGLNVFNWDEFPEQPIKPDRPIKPRNQMDIMLNMPSFSIPGISSFADHIPLIDSIHSDPNTAKPTIQRNSPVVVEWDRPKIMHHIPFALTTLVIIFPATVGDKDYCINYKIFAENLPSPVEGKLYISTSTQIIK